MQPTPAQLAQQIQQHADNLINVLRTHHGLLRGTYEAAIAEAQGAELVGSAGQTFQHIESLEQGANALLSQKEAIGKSLSQLRNLDPRAAAQLGDALRPALDKARQLIDLAQNTRQVALELFNTGNAQRLGGTPLQTGRDVANLASEQISQLGRNLVPGAIAEVPWVEETLEEIEEQPVTLQELAESGKQIAAVVGAGVAATAQAGGAAAVGSAVRGFFGAAVEVLEAIGSRFMSLPYVIPSSILHRGQDAA